MTQKLSLLRGCKLRTSYSYRHYRQFDLASRSQNFHISHMPLSLPNNQLQQCSLFSCYACMSFCSTFLLKYVIIQHLLVNKLSILFTDVFSFVPQFIITLKISHFFILLLRYQGKEVLRGYMFQLIVFTRLDTKFIFFFSLEHFWGEGREMESGEYTFLFSGPRHLRPN